MPENPMMMMVPPGMGAVPHEEPDVEAIPDSVLDKYEKVYQGFRETTVHLLRGIDSSEWPHESECIHLLMHIDSKMEMALEWIKDRRETTITEKAEARASSPAPGEGGAPHGNGAYI